MGCSSSKTTPFDDFPPTTINELTTNLTTYLDQDVSIHLKGVCTSSTLIRSPFNCNDPTHAAIVHKVTVKKQSGVTTSGSRAFIQLFEAYGSVPFQLQDQKPTILVNESDTPKIIIRTTIQTHVALKFMLKVYNLEYDPSNPNDLYGGGKKYCRAEMKSIPKSGTFYKSFCNNDKTDGLESIQSKDSKYGNGFQRAVWVRSLQDGDYCAIKGKVVSATPKDKSLYGENVIVIMLDALSNVDQDDMSTNSGTTFSNGPKDTVEEISSMVDMTEAPVKWVKTNRKGGAQLITLGHYTGSL